MTDYTWNIRKEMAMQTASLNILFAGNFDLNFICQSLSLFKLFKFNLWSAIQFYCYLLLGFNVGDARVFSSVEINGNPKHDRKSLIV